MRDGSPGPVRLLRATRMVSRDRLRYTAAPDTIKIPLTDLSTSSAWSNSRQSRVGGSGSVQVARGPSRWLEVCHGAPKCNNVAGGIGGWDPAAAFAHEKLCRTGAPRGANDSPTWTPTAQQRGAGETPAQAWPGWQRACVSSTWGMGSRPVARKITVHARDRHKRNQLE